MLNISEQQQKLLLQYIPEAEKYIFNEDINVLLDLLDDKITEIGFNNHYELNPIGLKLQSLYDQLYNQN